MVSSMSLLYFLFLVIQTCTAVSDQILLKSSAQTDDLGTVAVTNHEFTLQHIFHHGVGPVSRIHRRLDISRGVPLLAVPDPAKGLTIPATPFFAASIPAQIGRLADRRPSTLEPLLDSAFRSSSLSPYDSALWKIDRIHGPQIDDKETIISLAEMSATAYIAPSQTDADDLSSWTDVSTSSSINNSVPVGWETIGLRGQVFVSSTKDIVVIALKGTSPPYYPGDKETTGSDRDNDNLLFSCCCGDSKYFYSPVCSCASSCSPSSSSSACPKSSGTASESHPLADVFATQAQNHICNQTCKTENLRAPDRYFSAAREIYTNVSLQYPSAQIWLTGHSLGGAMASLLGTAYGLPVVTFEAPGEAAATKRLSLPISPLRGMVRSAIYHFGHTADPIYTGDCSSFFSTCQLSGYFFETKCHTGNTCTYDTVSDHHWINWIGNHRIPVVIDSVLKKYAKTAECVPVDESCVDCGGWNFYN